MKKTIKFFQIIFVIAGLILILGEKHWFPDYYKPDLMGAISFAYAFFIHLPVLIWPAKDSLKENYRSRLQLAIAVGLFLSGLGSLGLWGLYKIGLPYDKIIHFIFPFLLAFTGLQFFKEYHGISPGKGALLILLIMVPASIIWELIEFGSSRLLGFGLYGRWFDRDSVIDIILDLAGTGAGILLVLRKHH